MQDKKIIVKTPSPGKKVRFWRNKSFTSEQVGFIQDEEFVTFIAKEENWY